MLSFEQMIQAVDSHTAGEPTRVVTGGLPQVPGATMAEKRDALQRDHDHLRRALVLEPRGHDAVIVAYLLPPTREDADLGVVFVNDAGYLGMCGHGSIGLATTAVAMGMVPAVEPYTTIKLDTTVGLVECKVRVEGGRPKSVTITNVPSFLYKQRVRVPVHGFGDVAVDIAYGGNWFYLVKDHERPVRSGDIEALTEFTWDIRQSLIPNAVSGRDGAEIDHIEVFAPPDGPGLPADSRNFVLCPGHEYDRSPCGTGTSGKMAVLHDRGELAIGERWRQESITGSLFTCWLTEEDGRLIPHIRGDAHVTGTGTLLFAADDELRGGFTAG